MARTLRATEAELLALDMQDGDVGVATDSGRVLIGTGRTMADNAGFNPGAGGATTLSGLTDTTLTAPSNGEVLTYNGAAWVNAASAGITSIDDVPDVDTTTAAPAIGEVLGWDGANWVPQAAGAGSSTFEALSDTPAYSGNGGQILRVNGAETGVEYFALSLSTADISDIDTGTTIGHVLTWDGSKWESAASAAGATNLNALTDVEATAPGAGEDGFVLTWVNASGEWQASAAGAASTTLATLTDTTLTAPVVDEILFYDGAAWINKAHELNSLSDVALTAPALNDIMVMGGAGSFGNTPHTIGNVSDVTLTAIAADQALVYNGAAWVNVDALPYDPTGLADTNILIYNAGTGNWEPGVAPSGTNVYTADGTLSGNRAVDCATNNLAWNDIGRWSATVHTSSAAFMILDSGGLTVYNDGTQGTDQVFRALDDLALAAELGSEDCVFGVASTTKGSLPAPRLTAAQKTAIADPREGMQVQQTDGVTGLYIYDGAAWNLASDSKYVQTFVSGDFSFGVLNIAAATHGQGTDPSIIQVYNDDGANYDLVGVDVSFNKTTGNLALNPGIGSEFNGKIVIKA